MPASAKRTGAARPRARAVARDRTVRKIVPVTETPGTRGRYIDRRRVYHGVRFVPHETPVPPVVADRRRVAKGDAAAPLDDADRAYLDGLYSSATTGLCGAGSFYQNVRLQIKAQLAAAANDLAAADQARTTDDQDAAARKTLLFWAERANRLTKRAVTEWVKSQSTHQRFRCPPRQVHQPILVSDYHTWTMDLIDLRRYSSGKYKWCLNCVESLSRYAF